MALDARHPRQAFFVPLSGLERTAGIKFGRRRKTEFFKSFQDDLIRPTGRMRSFAAAAIFHFYSLCGSGWPHLPGMNAMSSARATAVATITVTSPPLRGMSPSRYPSSRGSPLRLPSLSGTAAGRAAWKRLSLRCIWRAYLSGVWRTLSRPSLAGRHSGLSPGAFLIPPVKPPFSPPLLP